MALIGLQNILHDIINKDFPRHIREGMVKGACTAEIEKGTEVEKVRNALNNVVQHNLNERRHEALVKEKEVDMLMTMKEFV